MCNIFMFLVFTIMQRSYQTAVSFIYRYCVLLQEKGAFLCTVVHISHPELCWLELSSVTPNLHHHAQVRVIYICVSSSVSGSGGVEEEGHRWVKVPAFSVPLHFHPMMGSLGSIAPTYTRFMPRPKPCIPVLQLHYVPHWPRHWHVHTSPTQRNTHCCHKPKVFTWGASVYVGVNDSEVEGSVSVRFSPLLPLSPLLLPSGQSFRSGLKSGPVAPGGGVMVSGNQTVLSKDGAQDKPALS